MPFRIAIIGVGPWGLYALERLIAYFGVAPPGSPVHIHAFESTGHFGAGANYRPDQPEWLRLNFPISHVDVWPSGPPRPVVPRPLALLDWLRQRDGCEWKPVDYTSRARVGEYLADAFNGLCAHLPDSVRLIKHATTVVDVCGGDRDPSEGPFVLRTTEGRPLPSFHEILLCPGHPGRHEDEETRRLRQWSEESEGAGWVGQPFPVSEWADRIPAGAIVGIRGMGLTFIDVALTLTEGRGGAFLGLGEQGPLRYEPSGREPALLVPISRSGLLPSPKPVGRWPNRESFAPRLLTRQALQRRRAGNGHGRLDAKNDILPLLEREMEQAYRAVADAGDPPFSMDRLLDAREPDDFRDPRAHHRATLRLLKASIEAARRGRERSAAEAAAEIWNFVAPVLVNAVVDGGLTAEGHRWFEERLARPFARRTFGPPLPQAQRLYALSRAGLLDFGVAPEGEAEPDPSGGGYRVRSRRTGGTVGNVAWLIDARVPVPDVSRDPSPLVRRLYERGWIRPFVNEGPGDERYCAGGIDVEPGTARTRGADGRPVPGLSAMGHVLEGWTLGANSLFRETNDLSTGWAAHVAARAREGARRT